MRSQRSKPNYVLLVVIFFIGFVVTGGILRLTQTKMWPGWGRFTLIQTKPSLAVLSVDPVTRQGVKLELPDDLEISTVEGRGNWRVAVLPELAEKHGWKWVGDSVADFLGITYTVVDKQMALADRVVWMTLSRGVRFETVTLEDTGLVAESMQADNSKVLGLSTHWQGKVRDLFMSAELAQEEMSIAIVNASGESGIGTRVARIVQSGGLRVTMVRTADESEKMSKCVIKSGFSVKQKKTLEYLQRAFDCSIEQKSELLGKDTELWIGTDYVKRVNGD